jgi:hypothetical protein
MLDHPHPATLGGPDLACLSLNRWVAGVDSTRRACWVHSAPRRNFGRLDPGLSTLAAKPGIGHNGGIVRLENILEVLGAVF